MAQAIKSALPDRLKPSNGDEAEFAKRHHGKTRSHMVSIIQFHPISLQQRREDEIHENRQDDSP